MHLFYAPDLDLSAPQLPLEESHHCTRVLRLNVGDTIWVTDGVGHRYQARLDDLNPKACQLQIEETLPSHSKHPYQLHVACAPTKNIDRFEWFLEKACEIGIDQITPLLCDHSERKTLSFERLNKILIAAMKQSQKDHLPLLNPLCPAKDFIQQNTPGFIAHCADGTKPFITHLLDSKHPSNITLLIGPEGDFSPNEIQTALQHGYQAISLGVSRLRTETAALFATAAIHTFYIN